MAASRLFVKYVQFHIAQEEMVHLNNVDRPGSDVDAYVNGLDRILRMKATVWSRERSPSDLVERGVNCLC